jgi:DNA-binding transcriptional MerR regulator
MSQGSGAGSEHELALLTDAAIGVLADPTVTDDPILLNLDDVPASVLKNGIIESAQAIGLSVEDANMLASVANSSGPAPQIAEILLAQLKRNEQLNEEIAETYRRRSELMVVDPITIGAAALLLCILRIRRLKLSKSGLDISFDPLKADMVKALLDWLKGQP